MQMTRRDIRDRYILSRPIDRKLTREQEDTIAEFIGHLDLELEEDTRPTMDLPERVRRK